MQTIKLSLLIMSLVLPTFAFAKPHKNPAMRMAEMREKRKQSFASGIKEIFMKGSLDGKSLFMVVGIEDGFGAMKDLSKSAIDLSDLKDIGNQVYNEEHYGDYVDHMGEAWQGTTEAAPLIFKGPWKSLKKIPQAYKISMENAQEAYYSSDNTLYGTLGFAGHAVWANVKGSYYLIIEAPVKAVFFTGVTALAVPATFAVKTTWIAAQVGYQAVKSAVLLASGVVAATYSVLSTTVAASAATIAGAAVGTYRGVKWLVTLPGKRKIAIKVKQQTAVPYYNLSLLAERLPGYLSVELLEQMGAKPVVEISEINKYDAKISLISDVLEGKKVATINLGVKDKNVRLTGTVTKKYVSALSKETDTPKGEIKAELQETLEALLKDAVNNVEAEMQE